MKTIYNILIILVLSVVRIRAAEISVEDFKKMSFEERDKVIEQASTERKVELAKIHHHLDLVDKSGGEAGYRNMKERYVIWDRGLGGLYSFFERRCYLWWVYSSNIATAEEKAAAPVEQVKEAFRKLNKQQDAFKKQVADAHNLILRVAPTPDALELSKQTGKWEEEFGASGLYESGEKITKELLAEFDRKANEVLGKIKMLPTLSRAQVEKDYNDFPDEKMR